MKQRIEWVDILKGLAIFLVVFGHVELYSIGHFNGFFNRLQDVFCMPLFFFLSGLFAKPQNDIKESFSCIKKKFIQLIIPFVVCGSFYLFIMSDKPWWALFWYPHGQGHSGYWFILVLFEIYLLFTLCQVFTRRMTQEISGKTFLIVALIIESSLALIYILCQKGIVIQEPWYTITSFVRLYYNFPFFIMGYLFMRNHNKITILFNKRVYNIASVIFIILYVISNKYHINTLPFKWILAFLAVITIVSLCHSMEYRISLCKNNCKRCIEYIGRHTMEIYVLHFFFIPRNMNYLKDIIAPNNLIDTNIIIELIINSCIAGAIIFVTLGCAFLISENVYLKQLLFGKTINRSPI